MEIKNAVLQHPIRINHIGFLCSGAKRFILTENNTGATSFNVIFVDDARDTVVYTGTLDAVRDEESVFYVGDFSHIDRCGDYFIEVGSLRSRGFVIYDGAYDMCERTMLQYFTLQRCGHALGWAGECHLDDGFIFETGEHIDLAGGYHQSCDLRKSPGGVSIGVNAMLHFALDDKSAWGKILVRDEVKWACDYFVKTIQPSGAMFNTLNAPFGWGGRTFYKSCAPSSAVWNVVQILSQGYRYFKNDEPTLAKSYLDKALLAWEYLTKKRGDEPYAHPDKFPVGMDPDFFYDQCKKGSIADVCYEISSARELFKATKDEKFLSVVRQKIPFVLSNLNGYILMRDSECAVTSSCSYTWQMGALFSLCDAYELLGDFDGLENALKNALDKSLCFAKKDIWRCFQKVYFEKDLDRDVGHGCGTVRQGLGKISAFDGYFYSAKEIFEPAYACYMGIFLARGANLLKNKDYLEVAQCVVDNLLGANAIDSCHINGIGYNQSPMRAYGQFFPSTPQLVGAVGVSYSEIDVYKNSHAEYDMPCVGISMLLISEVTKSTLNLK
jgi:hypothetical protein